MTRSVRVGALVAVGMGVDVSVGVRVEVAVNGKVGVLAAVGDSVGPASGTIEEQPASTTTSTHAANRFVGSLPHTRRSNYATR